MRWATVVVALALVAVVAVNVLLLGYGVDRNDPVGRLSPVAGLPAPVTAEPATTTTEDQRDRDGHGADD